MVSQKAIWLIILLTHITILEQLMIDFLNEGRAELYDLENDPAETTNLIDSEDEEASRVKAELRGRILDVMREIKDPALAE